MTPRVGLTPTMPFRAAGTRPEPAVSVPRAKSTRPSATATADPALEPPEIFAGSHALRTAPYGLRVPTRPVANWSRLVLPITTAPALRSRATQVASRAGRYSYEGAPAVVGSPATSMLSLTAATRPASGSCSPAATAASIAAASARASAAGRSVIQTSGRPTASMEAYAAVTRATALTGRQRSSDRAVRRGRLGSARAWTARAVRPGVSARAMSARVGPSRPGRPGPAPAAPGPPRPGSRRRCRPPPRSRRAARR